MPPPSVLPQAALIPHHLSYLPILSLSPTKRAIHCSPNPKPHLRFPSPSHHHHHHHRRRRRCGPIRCSASAAVASSPPVETPPLARPPPAEVCRTIVEISSTGSLSTLTPEGWPLGIGARFVVDGEGTPALCLNGLAGRVSGDGRSSFQVQLEQSGLRTPQCTILGRVSKPEGEHLLKKLCAKWEKKFGEVVDSELLYVVTVEQVLHMEDFKEDGVLVTALEYINANPDPLRSCAQKIVDEMNERHSEDVQRLCNVFVDTDFKVMHSKLIWVDRLGFDLRLHCQNKVFDTRIPFPIEVTDEKGVKSSFNCMTHLAWEVEKNFVPPEFEKVKLLKSTR